MQRGAGLQVQHLELAREIVRDGEVIREVVEWSDPRLPHLLRFSENYDVYLAGDDPGAVISVVSSVRLEGPEGWWTGFEYGLIEESEAERMSTRLIVLGGAAAGVSLSAGSATTRRIAAAVTSTHDERVLAGPPVPLLIKKAP